MKFNLTNCGGIRLVDHATGTKRTFGLGTFSRTVSVDDTLCTVLVENDPQITPLTRMIMPGFRNDEKPLLDIDGKVYLEGIHILSGQNEEFDIGGYLGTVNHVFSFSKNSQTATVTLPTLGVIHSTYSGGLKISNLNTPGTNMINNTDPDMLVQGRGRLNFATIVESDGIGIDVYNWYASSDAMLHRGVAFSLRMMGAVGYDFRITVDPVQSGERVD